MMTKKESDILRCAQLVIKTERRMTQRGKNAPWCFQENRTLENEMRMYFFINDDFF